MIEASEPVAYLTSQPDPLTVLVDLRNVNASALDGKPVSDMLAPVSGGRRRERRPRRTGRRWRASACGSTAPPSIACAARATRSWWRSIAAPVRAARRWRMPGAAQRRRSRAGRRQRPRRPSEKRAAATELRSVRFAKIENGFSVTLAGNGPLLAAIGRRSEGPAASRAAGFPRRGRRLGSGRHQRSRTTTSSASASPPTAASR